MGRGGQGLGVSVLCGHFLRKGIIKVKIVSGKISYNQQALTECPVGQTLSHQAKQH